jgi:hypothetical protein
VKFNRSVEMTPRKGTKMDMQSIYPATKTVPFLGGTVEVSGLSLRAAAHLTIEFPVLLALASGTADIASLVVVGPDAALAILAQGLRHGPDKDLLKAFDEAPAGQQIDLLSVIVDLTFKGERAGPFLEGIAARAAAPSSVPPAATSAKTSPASSDT